MAYTYDAFQKAASGSNVNFSQYDLDLAKKYPEFGMSVLDLKKQYAGATTAEQRALINAKANQLRSSYGNYTAGADGSQYVSDGKYAPKIDETLDKIGSFKPFTYGSAPSYENRFQQKQQELLDAALKRDPFSWSKETDPQYGSYKKTYLREGERATADALAKASAASGGRPSSFAVNAATQAGDYYATKLSDVIPTLYQQAYERYLKDYQMKLSDLNAVNQQEQLDYAMYLDQLGQFNTDRNFDYNNYLGEYNRLQDYLGNLQVRFPKAADQVFYPVAPVPELAVAGNLFAVHNFGGRDLGNVRQSGENAVAVFVPKPLFDTVFLVQPGGDGVVPAAHRLAAGRVVI